MDGWLTAPNNFSIGFQHPSTYYHANGNSVEVHPQLSHNRLPKAGALEAVGSLDGPTFLSPIISSKTMASSFVLL